MWILPNYTFKGFSQDPWKKLSLWYVMWIIDFYFICMTINTIQKTLFIKTMSMHKSMFDYIYIFRLEFEFNTLLPAFVCSLLNWISDLQLMAYIYFQYCFIYATGIGKFSIMLMDTILLKFFTFGSPTLLYISCLTWPYIFVFLWIPLFFTVVTSF